MGDVFYNERARELVVCRYLVRQARIARGLGWHPMYVARYLNRAGEARRIVFFKGLGLCALPWCCPVCSERLAAIRTAPAS